jgi:DNA-binding PadR family transcriptional regulator
MKNNKIIKPTLLDYAILGLIQDQPLSGYAILKLFKETALGNYSSSPGTIYPALKRLQKFELVKKQAQGENGKACFEITTNGILILKNWFLKPVEKIDVVKKTDELLLRFGFMEALVDKKQRINFLTSFHDLLNIYTKELQTFYNKESNKMPLHGRLAFQYGIDSNKTTLKWCKKAISQLV